MRAPTGIAMRAPPKGRATATQGHVRLVSMGAATLCRPSDSRERPSRPSAIKPTAGATMDRRAPPRPYGFLALSSQPLRVDASTEVACGGGGIAVTKDKGASSYRRVVPQVEAWRRAGPVTSGEASAPHLIPRRATARPPKPAAPRERAAKSAIHKEAPSLPRGLPSSTAKRIAGPTPAFKGREATPPPRPKASSRIIEPFAAREQTPRRPTDQHESVLPAWRRIELKRARAAFKGERPPACSASIVRRAVHAARASVSKRAHDADPSDAPEGKAPRGGAAVVYATNAARRRALAERRADALLAKLPPAVRATMAGTAGGGAVPQPELDRLVRAMVIAKGGPDGAKTDKMRRAFELLQARARTDELPNHGLPAEPALIASIVSHELRVAVKAAAGSRGGATVGKDRQEGFIGLAECGLPITADHPLVDAATLPPPWLEDELALRPTKQAAAMPLAVQLQFETISAHPVWSPMRTFARSILLACLLTHVRLNDALNAVLIPDERRPDRVVRGRTVMKQKRRRGAPPRPVELYAPAEGWLGPIGWLEEHLAEISGRGHAVPDFAASYGRVSRATELREGVCCQSKARQAFKDVCQQPPLLMTDAEWAAWGITTHSPHTNAGDLVRFMMAKHVTAAAGDMLPEGPSAADFVPRPFAETDARELGHWLRDRNAPQPDPRMVPGAPARNARDGAPVARGGMSLHYSSGAGRRGERHAQLELRARVVAAVRQALARLDVVWYALPRGTDDWDIL